MFDRASDQPAQFLTVGALIWLGGLYLHYASPVVVPAGATGYLYGTLALIGGVCIGIGFERLSFPAADATPQQE